MSQCLTAFCGILVKPINLVLQHTLCPSSPILQRPSKCRFNFISLWISPERVKACKKKLKKLVTQLYSHVGWVTSFFFHLPYSVLCCFALRWVMESHFLSNPWGVRPVQNMAGLQCSWGSYFTSTFSFFKNMTAMIEL